MDSYRQFVLARIIVVIDLWLFGHLFAPPAAGSACRFRQIDPILAKVWRPLGEAAPGAGRVLRAGPRG